LESASGQNPPDKRLKSQRFANVHDTLTLTMAAPVLLVIAWVYLVNPR
jgi:hypothetical protein